jgi:hypothetical protein
MNAQATNSESEPFGAFYGCVWVAPFCVMAWLFIAAIIWLVFG